jgi:hypothetical protein
MPAGRRHPEAEAALPSKAADGARALAASPEGRSISTVQLRAARPMNADGSSDLERDARPEKPAPVRLAEERLLEAMKAHDVAKALTLASVLVYMDPTHAVAQRIKDRCAKLPDHDGRARTRAFPRPDAIPRQCVPWSDLRRRTLSRNEAYLLWCVDGRSTVEAIVDASAMPPLVAFETLDSLIREGIVELS